MSQRSSWTLAPSAVSELLSMSGIVEARNETARSTDETSSVRCNKHGAVSLAQDGKQSSVKPQVQMLFVRV